MQMDNKIRKKSDIEGVDELYEHLAEGISSMKSGEIYTIEEAWQDKIKTIPRIGYRLEVDL